MLAAASSSTDSSSCSPSVMVAQHDVPPPSRAPGLVLVAVQASGVGLLQHCRHENDDCPGGGSSAAPPATSSTNDGESCGACLFGILLRRAPPRPPRRAAVVTPPASSSFCWSAAWPTKSCKKSTNPSLFLRRASSWEAAGDDIGRGEAEKAAEMNAARRKSEATSAFEAQRAAAAALAPAEAGEGARAKRAPLRNSSVEPQGSLMTPFWGIVGNLLVADRRLPMPLPGASAAAFAGSLAAFRRVQPAFPFARNTASSGEVGDGSLSGGAANTPAGLARLPPASMEVVPHGTAAAAAR